MKEYIKMIKNTFNYSGRTRRREYWVATFINSGIMIFLFSLIFIGATVAGDCLWYNTGTSIGFATAGSLPATIFFIPYALYSLFSILTLIPLNVRRLQDTGKPGWVFALTCVGTLCCCIGAIVQFVFCCFNSVEDNKWGPNPKLNNEYHSPASIIGTTIFYIVAMIILFGAMFINYNLLH